MTRRQIAWGMLLLNLLFVIIGVFQVIFIPKNPISYFPLLINGYCVYVMFKELKKMRVNAEREKTII